MSLLSQDDYSISSKRRSLLRDLTDKSMVSAGFPGDEDDDEEEQRIPKQTDRGSTISSRNPSIPDGQTLIKSYKRYVYYNSIRFMVVTLLMCLIANGRYQTLHNHYDTLLCNFCYQQASNNTNTIFEWQICYYDYNMKSNANNLSNLSTNYVLFNIHRYYLTTAIIILSIAVIYTLITWWIAVRSNSIDVLLRRLPLEIMLSYNVFLSMLCFYQIIIDYQFYKDNKIPTLNDKECYVDSLNITTEHIMRGVLITAFVYIITPFFIFIPIHCCKNYLNKTIFSICTMTYNWLTFGCCSIIIIAFFGFLIFYTFGLLLPNFHYSTWILIIMIEIVLIMSFFDIYLFAIFKYPRNPFVTIIKSIGCYTLCFCKKNRTQRPGYRHIIKSLEDKEEEFLQ